MDGLKILDQDQIQHRIDRMAYQVYEEHFNEPELFLAGISNKGYALAEIMQKKLTDVTEKDIFLKKITFDKKKPVASEISFEGDLNALEDKVVIIVDDVINSGVTLFYACQPFMHVLLKKLKVLVLVNRDHLEFPVKPDYSGLSLSTTLQEHIRVELNQKEHAAYLL